MAELSPGDRCYDARPGPPEEDVATPAAAEMFREALHVVRRFYVSLCTTERTEEEHASLTAAIGALDEQEKDLEALIREGVLDRETQAALIVMAKRLRAGLEDFEDHDHDNETLTERTEVGP